MSQLVTLLIHPDPEVRSTLREALAEADFLNVLGEAVSGYEALQLLDAIPYGVFFVGVDLDNEISGIELAQILMGRKHKPALVFIAKDESQAFKAFELGAIDYLLWPITGDRLIRTFERLKQFKAHYKLAPTPGASFRDDVPLAEAQEDDGDETTVKLPLGDEEQEDFLRALQQAWDYTQRYREVEIEKLAISLDGRTILIPYNQIIFVEAYEDYSYVHTANQKFLTSYRLKVLEERLRHHRFFRVHRKYLVNLDMVTEIANLPGSNFMLRTAGRTRIELPISRRRINELKQVLGL